MSESLAHLLPFPLDPVSFNQTGGTRTGALLIGGPIPKELISHLHGHLSNTQRIFYLFVYCVCITGG